MPVFSTRKLQEREDDSLLQLHHDGHDDCTQKHGDPFATSSRVPLQQSRVSSAAVEASLRKIVGVLDQSVLHRLDTARTGTDSPLQSIISLSYIVCLVLTMHVLVGPSTHSNRTAF